MNYLATRLQNEVETLNKGYWMRWAGAVVFSLAILGAIQGWLAASI